ncbi:MAG: hypothetical protein R3C11_18665 [Planctomycetaceae bacterium]
MNNNDTNDPSQKDESSNSGNSGSELSSIDDQNLTGSPLFKDRKSGLIIFGILQILMGLFCAMLIPLILLSQSVTPAGNSSTNVRMLVPALGMYSILAVLLVWLGTGSILARRWARALTLVLAWTWLVIGITSMIIMVIFRPFPVANAAPGQQVPPQMYLFFLVVMLGTMGCIYILLPGIFIWFYRSPHVKATCEYHDPHLRWTDRCPLPVLAISLMLGAGAFSMIFSASYGFVIPFFGILLKGVVGGILTLGITLLFAYLSWATYKLKIWAWWATLILYVAFGLSSMITFSRLGLMEFYREINLPEEQLRIIEQSGMIERMNMPVMIGVSGVVFIGYLFWIRKYFVSKSVPNVSS